MADSVWLIPALLSSLFAGITAVIAKIGLKKTDSDCVTALRTVVVLVFAWLMVWVTGSDLSLDQVDSRSMILLLLSGLATGGSWLCYFKALSLGSVQSVAPVDKSSIVWTMLFGALIFQEDISSPTSIIGMILIVLGIVLMLPSAKGKSRTDGKKWLVYAIFSAVFASASALLGKAGIEGVDSYLGTAVRTLVVVVMAWLLVLVKRKGTDYNMPTQRSMEMGLFTIKETTVCHSDGHTTISKTPKITGAGQLHFINKFLKGDA